MWRRNTPSGPATGRRPGRVRRHRPTGSPGGGWSPAPGSGIGVLLERLVRLRLGSDRPPRLREALPRAAPGGKARSGQGARPVRAEPEPGGTDRPGRRPALGSAGDRSGAGRGDGPPRARPIGCAAMSARSGGSPPWLRFWDCSARSSRPAASSRGSVPARPVRRSAPPWRPRSPP